MSRLFAALYVSEIWYSYWSLKGRPYYKARAVVLFDRIMACEENRVRLNGTPLDEYIDEVVS